MAIVKRVNSRGQVVLGKQHAGRHALVEEPEPGVWIVKLGDFVPADEQPAINRRAENSAP